MWNGKAAERGKTIATLARICPTKKLADADGTRPLITCHPLSHASLFLEDDSERASTFGTPQEKKYGASLIDSIKWGIWAGKGFG